MAPPPKITDEQVAAARARIDAGETQAAVAADLGCTTAALGQRLRALAGNPVRQAAHRVSRGRPAGGPRKGKAGSGLVRAAKGRPAGEGPLAPPPGPAAEPVRIEPPAPGWHPGPAVPAPLLAQLAERAAALPLDQQDRILSALPLDRLRLAAVARGLAGHPAAAQAVARELRAVGV